MTLSMKDTCFIYLSRSNWSFGPKRIFDNEFGYSSSPLLKTHQFL
uniref:Uncharacterized protein n=1 Tax=Cucumis melo TaxID=3656 RepID=A0A9I9EI50_CUCME